MVKNDVELDVLKKMVKNDVISVFGTSDGGSKIVDFLMFGFLMVMVSSVLMSSLYLYAKRKNYEELKLRSTHLKLQIIQSVAGLFWFLGFAIKIGTFNRGKWINPNNEFRPYVIFRSSTNFNFILELLHTLI